MGSTDDDHDGDAPVKLADFGLAASWRPDTPLTEPCGTPEYVAPEVLTGHVKGVKGYGPPVDVWSIGCLTYILMVGYAPFYGDGYELLEQVKSGSFEFEKVDWEGTSLTVQTLIMKMLSVDPDLRP